MAIPFWNGTHHDYLLMVAKAIEGCLTNQAFVLCANRCAFMGLP
jgi:hypothetical protein